MLAARDADDAGARKALEELCRDYWYPLFAFARRKGARREDAEELVQGFLTRLVEHRDLRSVSKERGRFRSFLMAALQHHIANERDRERAVKRGGGAIALAADVGAANERFEREPDRGRTPEEEFDRAWALEVLSKALVELEREYAESSRAALFEALRGELEGAPAPHADIALRLGMTSGAVKTAAHRLRERFGERLRALVAGTVASPAAVEAELGALLRALSR